MFKFLNSTRNSKVTVARQKHTEEKNVWLRKINFYNVSLIETFYSDILVKSTRLSSAPTVQNIYFDARSVRLLLHTQSNLQINFSLVAVTLSN
jgi:hypothetical protein